MPKPVWFPVYVKFDNVQINKSRLAESEFDLLLRCFAIDMSATQVAKLSGINRNTVNRYFNEIREVIYSHYGSNTVFSNTVCEVDESYFGARRVRGKAGRGAYGKVIVFGIIERGGLVYSEIIQDTTSNTLIPIITTHIEPTCIINSNEWRSYRPLSGLGYIHNRIKHSANIFADGNTHTNTIESYWSCCKNRLSKFNGISRDKIHLHIKECEYRFNHRTKDMYKSLLNLLSQFPLF